jgi:bifunctional UDP-N-acetylglucosamine pyrophosphorylase/glucosamine-1-phosphate N-acetyltransferase
MVNKVIIAAAGKGTRMLSLSKDKPKHLIEINDKPFLSYLLDNIFLAGYKDITLVVGYMPEAMESFRDNYIPPVKGDFELKIVNQFEHFNFDDKSGTAVPLMCVKNINEQFLYISGDNFYSVEDLRAININDDYNYVSGVVNKHPENFGVLSSEGEFLTKIVEKPKEFVGSRVNASLYKFTPEIFEKINKIEKSPRGEYEITDAVTVLAKEKKVKINNIKGFWMDFGRPEDIEKLSNFINADNKKK